MKKPAPVSGQDKRSPRAYHAKFTDGKPIPPDAILFAGISMGEQPKLKGRKLEAFAKLFKHSDAKEKHAYLGDTLQRFNTAARYIINRVKSQVPLKEENWTPEAFLEDKRLEGNHWLSDHHDKFCTEETDRRTIVRDSDIEKNERFKANLADAVKFYLNPHNKLFIEAVDNTTMLYMRRNELKVPEECQNNGITEPLNNNDPVSQCVIEYIQRKKASSDQPQNYLDNPIYQALLRLSYSYVLYELAGFRTAIQILKANMHPDHRNYPVYFIYPGKLDIIRHYFDLIGKSEVVMLTKEIKYRPRSALSSPDEDTQSSESPPSPGADVMARFFEARMRVNPHYTITDAEEEIRQARQQRKTHRFTTNIGQQTIVAREDSLSDSDDSSKDLSTSPK